MSGASKRSTAEIRAMPSYPLGILFSRAGTIPSSLGRVARIETQSVGRFSGSGAIFESGATLPDVASDSGTHTSNPAMFDQKANHDPEQPHD